MAISRIKTSSVLQGFPKSRSLLAGNSAFMPGNYDSIATVTVGSGGSATIDFTSIPSTYTHLQIRGIARTNRSNAAYDIVKLNVNSDTGNNYSHHFVYGDGSGTAAGATTSTNTIFNYYVGTGFASANIFGTLIIDILDYANTNKYKTTRTLGGVDFNNGSFGFIVLGSGNWRNTNAITSISLAPQAGNSFNQYTQFALYGIKAGS